MDAQNTKRFGVIVLAASLLLTAACSGGGNASPQSQLAIAQANLTKAQDSLDTANKAAADASAAFCTSAASYITALDRYGDLINQSAVTVGDVATGGADLEKPSQATQDAAKDVVSTRDDVAKAQQDVADAEAAVAAAQASASGTEPPAVVETPTPTPTPLIPTATVDRVKQAEADFASTKEGISDDTPLREASEQFNSAVVALQVAWIQLFAQSGCLSDERQAQASDVIRSYTLALQQQLTDAGYYTGPIDGIYGPLTVAAVVALQAANDLPQTGTVDRATADALEATLTAKGAATAQATMLTTAALQQTLKLAGYWDGPVDGQWSDALTAAVASAQTNLGVPATGVVDSATIEAFQKALAAVLEPAPAPSSTD
ncbi:peptidoglycan-binding domain-containing protein [Cellulomonas sp. McL0617]|uniref:peptidoglycan-binding domain-containing protein n=1 Tax=Cellulomonas sp. McL0617 TaxID=3415675 RepID=UPI003CF1EE1B